MNPKERTASPLDQPSVSPGNTDRHPDAASPLDQPSVSPGNTDRHPDAGSSTGADSRHPARERELPPEGTACMKREESESRPTNSLPPEDPTCMNREDPEARRARMRGLLREMARIAALGAAYFLWLTLTGIGIPCPIRLMTGYLCPGCGITHCFLALARLDFRAAFEANALIFCLLPLALPYGAFKAVRYVRHGEEVLSLPEIIIFSLIMVLAVCFALYRNGILL